MTDFARNLAAEQRKRLVGAVMAFAEDQMYPHLPTDVRRRFREKVLASVGQYHDFVLDIIRASIAEPTVTNELALTMLREIHAGQARVNRLLESED